MFAFDFSHPFHLGPPGSCPFLPTRAKSTVDDADEDDEANPVATKRARPNKYAELRLEGYCECCELRCVLSGVYRMVMLQLLMVVDCWLQVLQWLGRALPDSEPPNFRYKCLFMPFMVCFTIVDVGFYVFKHCLIHSLQSTNYKKIDELIALGPSLEEVVGKLKDGTIYINPATPRRGCAPRPVGSACAKVQPQAPVDKLQQPPAHHEEGRLGNDEHVPPPPLQSAPAQFNCGVCFASFTLRKNHDRHMQSHESQPDVFR